MRPVLFIRRMQPIGLYARVYATDQVHRPFSETACLKQGIRTDIAATIIIPVGCVKYL